jgi:protein-tyrosine phosphatase
MNRTKVLGTIITGTIVLIVVSLLVIQPFSKREQSLEATHTPTFETLVNFRDLGTYQLGNGGRIAEKRLLRSASLHKLSDADMHTLVDTYGLKHVIDLRTSGEVSNEPNKEIAETTYHHIDLYKTGVGSLPTFSEIQEVVDNPETRIDIVDYLRRIYSHVTLDPDSHEAMNDVFDVLLENETGAVLWHCTSGKDRTGLTSAILLHILGASKETIYDDYMKTNELRKTANDAFVEKLRDKGASDQLLEDVHEILLVRREYLDYTFDLINEHYGDLDTYIEDALQISQADQAKLRKMYLR